MKQPRQIAYEVLSAVLYKGAYSNIALNQALRDSGLENLERGFVTELVYGALSKRYYFEYVISKLSKTKLSDLSDPVHTVLMMGLYQIRFMNSVTDFAAVDESVKLMKRVFPRGSGFVNGLLRNALRNPEVFEIESMSEVRALQVRYNVSMDIAKLLKTQYGSESARRILERMQEKPKLYLRVNQCRTNAQALAQLLEEQGVVVEQTVLADALCVSGLKRIEENAAYKAGLFTVQDISSMQAVAALNPQPGESVLDLCAAPGGKTTYIAEKMQNSGSVMACDISERKLDMAMQSAKRLGLACVQSRTQDATVREESFVGAFDRVLVDAPCSGLGIMRKKPELRYKTRKEISGLYAVQARILQCASEYVKPSGMLVYSTCTINKEENEEQIAAFLNSAQGAQYQLQSEQTLLMQEDASDGFYIAVLRRA